MYSLKWKGEGERTGKLGLDQCKQSQPDHVISHRVSPGHARAWLEHCQLVPHTTSAPRHHPITLLRLPPLCSCPRLPPFPPPPPPSSSHSPVYPGSIPVVRAPLTSPPPCPLPHAPCCPRPPASRKHSHCTPRPPVLRSHAPHPFLLHLPTKLLPYYVVRRVAIRV